MDTVNDLKEMYGAATIEHYETRRDRPLRLFRELYSAFQTCSKFALDFILDFTFIC